MSIYGKTHYNIVISLQLIKINGKKIKQPSGNCLRKWRYTLAECGVLGGPCACTQAPVEQDAVGGWEDKGQGWRSRACSSSPRTPRSRWDPKETVNSNLRAGLWKAIEPPRSRWSPKETVNSKLRAGLWEVIVSWWRTVHISYTQSISLI